MGHGYSYNSKLIVKYIQKKKNVLILYIYKTILYNLQIDPRELKGQTLIFGEKSKFKINDEKYCALNQEVKCNVTCVLHTGKIKSRYKTGNIFFFFKYN